MCYVFNSGTKELDVSEACCSEVSATVSSIQEVSRCITLITRLEELTSQKKSSFGHVKVNIKDAFERG